MTHVSISTTPQIALVQRLLSQIDQLRLPDASRRDVESVLVRHVGRAMERFIPGKRGHGARTAQMAIKIGRAAGLSSVELHHLKLAAYLHDIGQLATPCLLHVNSLEGEDYARMQSHPWIGAQMLESFIFLREAAILVAHHHERWDGFGYPYGLRGAFIPLGARILAVADAFDAIEMPGPTPLGTRDRIAYRILRVASGTQFDPRVIELLGLVFESYQPENECP
ncbi:MAG TPA: HD domain-containing phosphohydrolase [Nitrospira sp.]|nr:HD domain-containing phosphohydrolase [Nitrospira sp.]